MSQKILNKRSSVFGKAPLPSQMEYGEIAINFNHENPFLSILDSNGEIQKFLSETKTRGLIQDAKEDIDNSFYTKEEINNMFEAFDPSGEVDFDNYYTKSESDSKYQPISGMSSYLTVISAENLYQPKGNYLTEHQSLENYYTKSEADGKFLTSHQDLSDYAQKSDLDDYLTISSASTIYATKSEIPDISDLATKSEIPDTSNFITSAFTESQYQAKGTYVVPSDLDDYALKSELPTVPDVSDFITSAFTEEHYAQVNHTHSQYAEKSEIPDTSNFITSAFTEEHYMKIGSTPTDVYTKAETDSKFQPQSGMTDYALKSELPSTTGLASEEWVSNNFSSTAHTHSDLATKAELENYLTIVSASTTYATKSEIPDISDLATKSEIPDTSNFITSGYTEDHYQPKGDYVAPSDLNDYALKSEIPSIEGLATEAELANYQPQSAMTGYSTTAHTHDYSEIQNTPDLSGFASLSDIPDTSNFITSAFTEDRYQPKGNYLTEHQSLENYYTKSEADNKFLTSHQDLSDYALKSEIPDVSNFVTSAFTDATYAKKGEVPSDAYTKAETDILLAGKANSAHTHTMSEITDLDVPKTWRGTLAQYNNLTEIDNDTLYIITDSSEQLVTSGDVESMISGYTNLTEVQTLLEGYSQTGHTHSYNDLTDKPTIPSVEGFATKAELENYQPASGMSAYSQTGHTHDYSEIENTPDLSGFASLSDIPDTSNFITSAFTEEHYMKIGSTPTDVYTKAESDSKFQPQSGMTDYALKSELPSTTGLASEEWVSNNFSTTAHTHSDLATKAELDDYLTIASASTIYATKEELEEFTPSDNYAGTVWTGTLSEYNNLTVIDTDTLYVITDANQQYVTSGQVESMTSGYTNLTEVQTLLEGYSTTAHTHSYNDLTDKPVIPSTTGLASETWVTNNFAGTGHTHSQYLTETSADTRYARVVSLTQAQYDALVQNDQVEQGVLYCIIEQSNS